MDIYQPDFAQSSGFAKELLCSSRRRTVLEQSASKLRNTKRCRVVKYDGELSPVITEQAYFATNCGN
jgi:hypothetical protein